MKKVTAKNLMIGDWVRYNKEYRQVRKLSTNEMRLSVKNDEYLCLICSTATPIPITEEWLKGNGWVAKERFNTSMFAKNLGKANRMTYITESDFLRVGENTYFGIQYIHQLQQAYRLATGGKELKVKF